MKVQGSVINIQCGDEQPKDLSPPCLPAPEPPRGKPMQQPPKLNWLVGWCLLFHWRCDTPLRQHCSGIDTTLTLLTHLLFLKLTSHLTSLYSGGTFVPFPFNFQQLIISFVLNCLHLACWSLLESPFCESWGVLQHFPVFNPLLPLSKQTAVCPADGGSHLNPTKT